jgi:nicotinamide-nucleotide amidase
MSANLQEVTGSLLTIGDEILLGDIANGNAHHIASELRSRGFRLGKMVTVGDRAEEIVEILCQCVEGSRFIIVTGGLGPTDDDRTCEAVSKAFNLPLDPDEEYTRWLKQHVAERGRAWTEEVARMAKLPRGSVKLGLEMAGFFIEHHSIPCYFLPGVPHEMRHLLKELVIPDLEARFPDRLVYIKHVLRIQGMPESEINKKLKDMSSPCAGPQIGYLPQVGENWVTIFVAAGTMEEAQVQVKRAEEDVIRLLGSEHISGHNDESLEKVVGRQLMERDWTLVLAESCTGGLLSRKITTVAGASNYFDRGFITYSNQAKMDLLDVPEELLLARGAVSEPVAVAMARGARTHAGADVAVSITGIAGPSGGSDEKPVGTVFIACVTPSGSVVEKHAFGGDRVHVQESAAQAALVLLWRTLSNDPNIHCH